MTHHQKINYSCRRYILQIPHYLTRTADVLESERRQYEITNKEIEQIGSMLIKNGTRVLLKIAQEAYDKSNGSKAYTAAKVREFLKKYGNL